MELLRWAKKFNSGHSKIDAQHVELVQCLDKMSAFSKLNNGRAVREKCREFEVLLAEHFVAEENILAASHFPRVEQHKLSHIRALQDYAIRIKNCGEECLTKNAPTCMPDLASVLMQHILLDDTDFRSHIQTDRLSDRV